MKNLIRFQYFTTAESPLMHQIRDSAIFIELTPMLYEQGYLYKDGFYNYPKLEDTESCPFIFGCDDLLVLTTRPPLTDKHQRRIIYQTGHILERKLLAQVGTCFLGLSRKIMLLRKSLAMKLSQERKNRAAITFFVNRTLSNQSAGYQQISEFGREKDYVNWEGNMTSCAFLMYFRETDELPKVLYVFGIGGQEGLIFARMLKNGLCRELNFDLNGPSRFVMVEFPCEIKEKFPVSLEFVKSIKPEVILDTAL